MTFEKSSVWKGYKTIYPIEYRNVSIEQDKYGGNWTVYKLIREGIAREGRVLNKEIMFKGNLIACKKWLNEKESVTLKEKDRNVEN